MSEYLHGVILNRMYNHSSPKFPNPIRIRDKSDGRVFDCVYGGYDARKDRHLYSIRDVNNGECFYQNPEGYIEKCEIVAQEEVAQS